MSQTNKSKKGKGAAKAAPSTNPAAGKEVKKNVKVPIKVVEVLANSQEKQAEKPAQKVVEKVVEKPIAAKKELSESDKKNAKAARLFASYPQVNTLYFCADGTSFFKECDAKNHSFTLSNKEVTPINR